MFNLTTSLVFSSVRLFHTLTLPPSSAVSHLMVVRLFRSYCSFLCRSAVERGVEQFLSCNLNAACTCAWT